VEAAAGEDMWPHTRRVLPWSLAVFVGAIFLLPFESISLPVSLPVGSTADRVLLIAIAGLWVVTLWIVEGPARPRIRLTRVHLLALAFFGLCCLGIGLNGHELAINQEVVPTLKKLGIVFSLVMFLIVASSVLRPREVASFLTMILWLGVIVGFFSIIESREHFDIFYVVWSKLAGAVPPGGLDQPDSIGRLSVEGPTIQPLELASLLAMVLPIALVRAMDAQTRKQRMKYLLAATVIVGGGLATSRKTSIVDPLVAVLILTAYRPRQMIKGMIASALPLFVIVHLAAPGQIGSVVSELLPGHINAVATTTDRTVRYDAVRPDIMSHFLVGRGFQSYDPFKYRILDNEFLGLLIGVGVIGLVIYLCIFGALMRFSQRMIRAPGPTKRSSALIMLAMLTVALVSNALFDVLSFSHVSYLFFFVAAMVIALRNDEPTPYLDEPFAFSGDDDWPVLSYEPTTPADRRGAPLPVA
jgi:O-antigen ligase